jgi:hypothetical protein
LAGVRRWTTCRRRIILPSLPWPHRTASAAQTTTRPPSALASDEPTRALLLEPIDPGTPVADRLLALALAP